MVQCSNPIQCQMAEREECKCKCMGTNHGVLRQKLTSTDPAVVEAAQLELQKLREDQEKLKNEKAKLRRQKRDAMEKAAIEAKEDLPT